MLHQSQNQTGLLICPFLKLNISQARIKVLLMVRLTTDNQTEIELELKNVPIDGTIKITQYNLFETEVTTYETTSIGADGKPILGYKEIWCSR